MELFLTLLIAAGLGLIPANIAQKKGHSFGLWWFYGWMLFIVAIIHVQFIEDLNVRHSYNYDDRNGYGNSNGSSYGNSYGSGSSYGSNYGNSYGSSYSNNNGNNISGSVNSSGSTTEPATTTVVNEVSKADELRKFKELYDMGAITEEEFNAQKKKLLGL